MNLITCGCIILDDMLTLKDFSRCGGIFSDVFTAESIRERIFENRSHLMKLSKSYCPLFLDSQCRVVHLYKQLAAREATVYCDANVNC